ncbi:unnamed protein product, partial [Brassica oleracea]
RFTRFLALSHTLVSLDKRFSSKQPFLETLEESLVTGISLIILKLFVCAPSL